MNKQEIVDLIRLYISECSDGWVVGVDTLVDILDDIDFGCSKQEIIDHYKLTGGVV